MLLKKSQSALQAVGVHLYPLPAHSGQRRFQARQRLELGARKQCVAHRGLPVKFHQCVHAKEGMPGRYILISTVMAAFLRHQAGRRTPMSAASSALAWLRKNSCACDVS